MDRPSSPWVILCAALAVTALKPQFAVAAIVTTNEAGMDAVFKQASFGTDKLDIHFLPTMVHVNPDFLNIQTSTEMQDLFDVGGSSPTDSTVYFFYVDTIGACGSTVDANIVGCGQRPGNKFAVESSWAAGSYGTELNSHELGHNLGLGHTAGANLMNPSLNRNTTLTSTQVSAIDTNGSAPGIQNRIVQGTTVGSQFISIQPILITSAPVSAPEPSSLAVLGLGALGFFGYRRRRARNKE